MRRQALSRFGAFPYFVALCSWLLRVPPAPQSQTSLREDPTSPSLAYRLTQAKPTGNPPDCLLNGLALAPTGAFAVRRFSYSSYGFRPCNMEYELRRIGACHRRFRPHPCVPLLLRVATRPVVGSPATPIMLSVTARPLHGPSATPNDAQRRHAASCWQNFNAEEPPSVGTLPVLGSTATVRPTSVTAKPSNGTATTVSNPHQHESAPNESAPQHRNTTTRHRSPHSSPHRNAETRAAATISLTACDIPMRHAACSSQIWHATDNRRSIVTRFPDETMASMRASSQNRRFSADFQSALTSTSDWAG